MNNYLKKEGSAFYHITFPNNWESIQKHKKLKSKGGKIFVVRSCNENILFSLAIGQLPNIYSASEIMVLKLSQTINNFLSSEIGIDTQSTEPTMPLQNIIYRKEIPLTAIELIKTIKCDIDDFNSKAAKFDNYKEGYEEFKESFEIKYDMNGVPMKLIRQEGLNNYTLVKVE